MDPDLGPLGSGDGETGRIHARAARPPADHDGGRVARLRCDSYKSPHEVAVLDPVAGKVLQTVGWAALAEVGINGLRSTR